MVKSKSIFNRISSNLNQAEGEKGEMVDELHDNKSVNSETRSQTNSWLKEKGLSEFVQKLRSEKLEIETLFECSRDELFEIFKGIGLKPQECVRLRFAVTSDKRWKGGLDVLFALKEKTYREVQQISKELAKSSITLSKVEDAKIAVSKTCDDYLKEITDAVEKIRTDAYLQIERVRTKNEEKMKTLTEAQREIQSVVQKLPIHDDKGRDKGICKIMKTVQNQLLENAEFRVDGLKAVKPDISKLKEAVSSYCIFTRKREQFMWDAEWKHSNVSVSNKGQTATVTPLQKFGYSHGWESAVPCQFRMAIRGTIGWNYGNHHWKMKVNAGKKNCGCSFHRKCLCGYYPISLGVCAESLSKSEIQYHGEWSGKKIVWVSNGQCYPRNKLISDALFTLNNGDILDLTLDLSVRTLKIKNERIGSTMVVKVPDGRIYPWAGFIGSQFSPISVTIIN